MPRKKDRTSLSRTNEVLKLYQDLVETSQDLIWQCDAEGRYTYLNPAWETVFGYTTDEMTGRKFSDFQTPEQAERDRQEFRRILQGGMVKGYETVHLSRSGEEIHLVFNAKSVLDEKGAVTGTRGTAYDITQRKKTENLLRQNEGLFSSLFFKSPVLLAIARLKDSILLRVNQVFLDTLGLTEESIRGKTSQDLGLFLQTKDRSAALEKLLKTGSLKAFEMGLKRPDGTVVTVLASSELISIDNEPCLLTSAIDITERKAVERALSESEERYRLLVESINTGIFQTTLDGTFIQMNSTVARMAGYEDPGELMKLSAAVLYANQTDREKMKAVIFRDGEIRDMEVQSIRKDGSLYWISINAVLQRGPDGQPLKFLGMVTDISERKKTETALRESEERYRILVEQSIVGIGVSKQNDIIFGNKALLAIFGYGSLEEFKSIPLLDHVAPSSRELIRKRMRRIAEGSQLEPGFEYEAVRKDGAVRTLRAYSTFFRLADGETYSQTTFQDITEQKRAETALRESEYFFKESQSAASIGSYKTDFINGIWESSEVLDRIFGIGQEYVRDIPGWLDLVHPDDRGMMARYLKEDVIGSRSPFNKEYRIIRKSDGQTRWVNGQGKIDFDPEGMPLTLIGTIQDITERKNTEAVLQNAQKLESLGVLAGGIAHDFNNLMAGIYGYLDLAASVTREPAVRDYLAKASMSIDRARGLTRQLLTFAKGGAPIRSIGRLFPFVSESVQFALSGSNITARFDVPEDLGSCHFDKNQIGQVIDNLVINARQAMPDGGLLTVRAANLSSQDAVMAGLPSRPFLRIDIADTGTGIDPEVLGRIFDPFFTTKTQGSGLGLSTSWSIVAKHDGTIRVSSSPGQGSVFSIFLPAVDRTTEPVLPEEVPAKTYPGSRVMVMDEEPSIRRFSEAYLNSLGCDVVTAVDGQEAIRLFTESNRAGTPFTLAILDLTIPGGMGGRETLSELHKIDPSLAAVAMSGYSDDPVMSDPERFGFTASLGKPFLRRDFNRIIGGILSDRIQGS